MSTRRTISDLLQGWCRICGRLVREQSKAFVLQHFCTMVGCYREPAAGDKLRVRWLQNALAVADRTRGRLSSVGAPQLRRWRDRAFFEAVTAITDTVPLIVLRRILLFKSEAVLTQQPDGPILIVVLNLIDSILSEYVLLHTFDVLLETGILVDRACLQVGGSFADLNVCALRYCTIRSDLIPTFVDMQRLRHVLGSRCRCSCRDGPAPCSCDRLNCMATVRLLFALVDLFQEFQFRQRYLAELIGLLCCCKAMTLNFLWLSRRNQLNWMPLTCWRVASRIRIVPEWRVLHILGVIVAELVGGSLQIMPQCSM